jgi:type II secretory pathway pseudopilin PulG
MKKIFLSKQAGISLVETLVGLSIAAGISLVLMRQQETSNKMQAKTNVDQNINSAVNIIQSSLGNRAICTKSIETKGVGDSITQIVDAQVDPTNFNNFIVTGKRIADTTTMLPGNIKIDSMNIISEGAGATQMDYLRVVFNRNPTGKTKLFGATQVPKKFRIQGQKNAAGKYTLCFSEASNLLNSAVQQACVSLGGLWNPTTSKCEIADLIKRSDLAQLWRNNAGLLTPVKPPDVANGTVTCQKSSKRCSRTNMDCSLPACPAGHYHGGAWEWDRRQSTWDYACMKSANCMYMAVPAGWMVKP